MKKISLYKNQIIILACTIALVVIGCVIVFSASSFSSKEMFGTPYHFLKKQMIGAVLGLGALLFASFFPFEKLFKYKWILVGISVVLLLLVFVPGIGKENYGARRWIGLGPLTMQPSEIAKFALVLFCASTFSSIKGSSVRFKDCLLPMAVGGGFCLLVILEPNMSITICLGLILVCMLFLGGMKLKHMLAVGTPAVIALPAIILLEPYRVKRLVAFLDPWATPKAEGFQLIQSLYAIGSGGWFGVGLFQSRQKFLFLPFAESDFIFSILVEELGLIGGLVVLALFATLIVCLVRVAFSAKNKFGCLLVAGVACVICVQVLLNVSVVSGLIPPTGLPLPFISAGSTSLVVFMAAIGVCLNVAKSSSQLYVSKNGT